MQFTEKTGRSVDEAIELALQELGVLKDQTEVEVIEEPQKGLFGFLGSKPAKVKVTVRYNPEEQVKLLLGSILKTMELPTDLSITRKNDFVKVDISGKDIGILIGRRGETLNALQYLVNLSVNKNRKDRVRVLLDVESYRKRREETLKRLALRLANKAKQKGKNVVLEPMNSSERRIIHTALQSRHDINTYSEGEEPFRKIIISPKK
ncbi:MAG TPA: RNA-binding cell elongation regulator Jag/EloR [Clostridia bacterium]|nr:RNA-binding cell elongation regulator Jag/EloR [Clostridia bacterium]